MVQRQKRLTKRERKALNTGGEHHHHTQHIHCLACGRHIEPTEFDTEPPTAIIITCQHGSQFPACRACELEARQRVAEHDRTGQPPRSALAWH